jgi:Protein of unknown function (DUF2946)
LRTTDDGDLMLWLRKHISNGSWLALFALAINFTLAFGHVHVPDGRGSEREVALIAASAETSNSQSQDHPTDHHADYLCPICMAVAAMGNALVSTSPALPVAFSIATIDRLIEKTLLVLPSPRAGFLSRGPPIS